MSYFTIIKDNGYIEPFIRSFSEIENIIDEFVIYYELSNSNLRKLKLLSLNNIEDKKRLITLQNLLNDKRFIEIYNEKPLPPSTHFFTLNGYYGSCYRLLSVYTRKLKIKSNTKNISYKNRFVGKVNRKIDFHKSNYKIK